MGTLNSIIAILFFATALQPFDAQAQVSDSEPSHDTPPRAIILNKPGEQLIAFENIDPAHSNFHLKAQASDLENSQNTLHSNEQFAEEFEGQFFEISANSNSLIAPATTFIIHDGTDNDQVFPTQSWLAVSTSLTGATVVLEAQGPFKNWLNPASKRDAQLDLAVLVADPLSGWAVTVATDQTDYSSGSNTAVVSASSTTIGAATLGLTVTFIEESASTLNAGSYLLTVIGSISGN